MTCTAAQATELLARLADAGDSPSLAAGTIGSELRAIAPYTCANLSHCQRVLRALATVDEKDAAKGARWRDSLRLFGKS